MGRDTFEKVSDHKIDDVSQTSNVVGIVVPNDVGLSSKNGGQRFQHSIVVRGVVCGDTMQFVT